MDNVDFVRCPKCRSLYWNDIPDLEKSEDTKWKCFRCSYGIAIGACVKCKNKNWKMTKGIDPKGGHRPVYRLQCLSCNRVIGFLIHS